MAGRPPQNQLGIAVASHKNRYDGAAKRRIYEWLVAHMTELGIPPTEMGRQVAGVKAEGRYRDFKRTRKRVESLDFDDVQSLSLRHLKPERDVSNWGFFDWTAYAHLNPEYRASDLWRAGWNVYFPDAGIDEASMLEHATEFARKTVTRYGYIAYKDRRGSSYTTGGSIGHEGRAVWGQVFREHAARAILRDVHYRNFLGQEYLDIEIEGKTLERWIEDHPQGGVLTPFNDDVMMWAPPVAAIPRLREELFRAGHLLYWEFFDPGSPHFRDWNKPFVLHEPIPDCFREAIYAGTDPKVIG